MAGEGFSKHASTSLSENRNLLRKKSMFKKERSFLNQKREDISSKEIHVTSKKASKYLLSRIKNKTLTEEKKETKTIAWAIGITCFLLFVMGSHFFNSKQEDNLGIVEQVTLDEVTEDQQRYEYLITSGDAWFKEEKYHNALFQYKKALEVFPNDQEAFSRVLSVYDIQCEKMKKNCKERDQILENWVQK